MPNFLQSTSVLIYSQSKQYYLIRRQEEAASIYEVARDEARLQIEATESAAKEDADASTINGHIEESRDVEAQANALAVEDTEVLAEVLGVQ